MTAGEVTAAGLLATARHESGHAVMAIALGCTVLRAGVHRSGDGFCVTTHGRGRRRDPMMDGLIAWAGTIAEGVDDGSIGAEDHGLMRSYGFRPSSVATLRAIAVRCFHEWDLEPAIAAVAALLAADVGGIVKGAAIRACALRAQPSLASRST